MIDQNTPASLSLVVSKQDQGRRLDDFVSKQTGISRARAVQMIQNGQVLVGKRTSVKGYLVKAGEIIHLTSPPQDAVSTPPVAEPELPLDVLYEDPHFVIVNKPAGMSSHPLRPEERGTLASAVIARYPECTLASEHAREGGVCHRLDRWTSGAILFARTKEAWQVARRAFSEGLIEKEYLALCQGHAQANHGEIKQPLLPERGQREKMRVAETPEEVYHAEALSAHTQFWVEQVTNEFSLLRVKTLTGRRHQIRAHLAYLGLPLYGDELYGGPGIAKEIEVALGAELVQVVQGQFLHASRLTIPSQIGLHLPGLNLKKNLSVSAPLPEGRKKLLLLLGFSQSLL